MIDKRRVEYIDKRGTGLYVTDNADNAGRSYPTCGKDLSQGVKATYMATTAGEGGETLP